VCLVCRLGLLELVEVRVAWAVVVEEREARYVDGRVEVRFDGDFRRRVDEVDVRVDDDDES